MKVLATIWADPGFYLATIFTAKTLSEQGVYVDLLYRRPNSHMNSASGVNFGINTRLWPIGNGHSNWRDKIDYVNFIVKAISLSCREKPDAVIGYDAHGVVAALIVTWILPKTKLIYHNFDFEISTKGGLLRRFLRRIELVAARRSDMTIFPAPGRATEYKVMARLLQ
jgi:UDP-N-acetylglucosamine:LPS N-acetylglucosamine transferase